MRVWWVAIYTAFPCVWGSQYPPYHGYWGIYSPWILGHACNLTLVASRNGLHMQLRTLTYKNNFCCSFNFSSFISSQAIMPLHTFNNESPSAQKSSVYIARVISQSESIMQSGRGEDYSPIGFYPRMTAYYKWGTIVIKVKCLNLIFGLFLPKALISVTLLMHKYWSWCWILNLWIVWEAEIM